MFENSDDLPRIVGCRYLSEFEYHDLEIRCNRMVGEEQQQQQGGGEEQENNGGNTDMLGGDSSSSSSFLFTSSSFISVLCGGVLGYFLMMM